MALGKANYFHLFLNISSLCFSLNLNWQQALLTFKPMASKTKKLRAPELDPLLSAPWGAAPEENSYYCDPSYVDLEQHGLEHIERDCTDDDDEGTEQVVILGYN